MHQFSIITPTYNRSKYLPRIYECLCHQDEIDFEWIIVDDGSTDNTKEIIKTFKSLFKIKYVFQENEGQLSARNTGTRIANSYILAKLDDDDLLCHGTLKKVWSYFNFNKKMFENDCVCLSGLCKYENGDIIGNKFPYDYFISDHISCRHNIPVNGDKYEFYLTDIIKKYPFPVIPGEKNMPPHIVHDRIARDHKTLYINNIFAIKYFFIGGLSSQKYIYKYTKGSELYFNEASMFPFNLKLQIVHSSYYIYFAKKNNKKCIYINALNKNIFLLGLLRYFLLLIKMFLIKFKIMKFLNNKSNFNKIITKEY